MGPGEPSFATMERVVAAAFAQRRKMLRAGLRAFTSEPIALLEAAGIDPTARAEELDIDAFRRLARAWDELQGRLNGLEMDNRSIFLEESR